MRSAMGFTAGPDKPPVTFASQGFRVRVFILIPVIVLMREMASAPDEAAASAVGRTSPLLGESFTMRGSVVARRTAAATSATACSLAPKTTPPSHLDRRRLLRYLQPLLRL